MTGTFFLLHWWNVIVEPAYWPESSKGYAFWSSLAGATAIFSGSMVVALHLLRSYWKDQCHVTGCHAYGHPVYGTSHRACRTHHPHLDKTTVVTAEDIARAAREGHNAPPQA
ncbi:MAG: hypothetical protein ABSG64_01025 [Solirubrobacteraceae bacterium]|jgi:hypothetical protein